MVWHFMKLNNKKNTPLKFRSPNQHNQKVMNETLNEVLISLLTRSYIV